MASPQTPFTVGVLALQGAFHEHLTHIARVSSTESDEDSTKAGQSSQVGQVQGIPVRTPEQLALCHALIIPGGESTAIALGAVRGGLLEPLRQWVRSGKPTWGTCAGMIMLAREATGGKKMQELIGGWDGRVSRNGWGSQVSADLAEIARYLDAADRLTHRSISLLARRSNPLKRVLTYRLCPRSRRRHRLTSTPSRASSSVHPR